MNKSKNRWIIEGSRQKPACLQRHRTRCGCHCDMRALVAGLPLNGGTSSSAADGLVQSSGLVQTLTLSKTSSS